ncbi:preprotein translocase subunit YajC [Corynebacterium matruchotii]|jgi:preprotein translocase subunit|uniref:preprotein translocase subunit YajC n=1 Tax=Corynebacterium matruchotii TaxID=43768 RepID=UPI0028EEEEDF|nr:preprotein translocase subunit YajC [Corynebacterium matruchotii]
MVPNNILLLILILLALMIPSLIMQRKRRRYLDTIHRLQENLMIGDVIITTAGLRATIRGIADTTVELETSPGVVSTWEKHVVIKNLTQEKKAQPAAEPEQQPVGELPAGEQPAAEKPADDANRAS